MGVKVEGMWPLGEVRCVLPKQLKGKDDLQWKYPGGTSVIFSESLKPQALYAENLRQLCGRNELWMEPRKIGGAAKG